MPNQTDVYKVEYPQEGITVSYGSGADENLFHKELSEILDIVLIVSILLPFLFMILITVRPTANAIIRQGEIEADRQAELRHARREENKT